MSAVDKLSYRELPLFMAVKRSNPEIFEKFLDYAIKKEYLLQILG
jgi:hypothetical protein